jgi:hypothetical protein
LVSHRLMATRKILLCITGVCECHDLWFIDVSSKAIKFLIQKQKHFGSLFQQTY